MEKDIVTLEQVRRDPKVRTFIEAANNQMNALGYTEHGFRHAGIVAETAQQHNSQPRAGRQDRGACGHSGLSARHRQRDKPPRPPGHGRADGVCAAERNGHARRGSRDQ